MCGGGESKGKGVMGTNDKGLVSICKYPQMQQDEAFDVLPCPLRIRDPKAGSTCPRKLNVVRFPLETWTHPVSGFFRSFNALEVPRPATEFRWICGIGKLQIVKSTFLILANFNWVLVIARAVSDIPLHNMHSAFNTVVVEPLSNSDQLLCSVVTH